MAELIRKLGEMGSASEIERIGYRGTYGSAKDLTELLVRSIAGDPGLRKESGALSRAPAFKKIRNGSRIGYTVGIRSGKRSRRNKDTGARDNPFYWWLLEFGTVHIAPRGFFRRAIEAHRTAALPTILAQARAAVLASGNRALRKHGQGGARAKA